MTTAMRLMKQAATVKTNAHYRLLFGRFSKLINNSELSESLQDSAKREFQRVARASFNRANA